MTICRRMCSWFYCLVLLITLLISTGCTTMRETTSGGNVGQSDVRGDGETLVKAFVDCDAEAFIEQLPPEMRKDFGVKQFDASYKSIVETLGKPISYAPGVTLENPLFAVTLWKVRFERQGSEGAKIYQEALFRVIAGELDGKSRIVSFNFL